MTTPVLIIIGIVAVVLLLVVVMRMLAGAGAGAGSRGRRSVDDIASFRRQIDALSPEARRQTSDRMKPAERAPRGDDGDDDQ